MLATNGRNGGLWTRTRCAGLLIVFTPPYSFPFLLCTFCNDDIYIFATVGDLSMKRTDGGVGYSILRPGNYCWILINQALPSSTQTKNSLSI